MSTCLKQPFGIFQLRLQVCTHLYLALRPVSVVGGMPTDPRMSQVNFLFLILKWFTVALPATFINSLIRFLEKRLALAFRTKLLDHSYDLYFRDQTYYRVSNLDGRIENADHRLTEEVTSFADSVAHIYSHVTKPMLDLLLVGYSMFRLTKKRNSKVNCVSEFRWYMPLQP